MDKPDRNARATPELWVAVIATFACAVYLYHGRRDGLTETASRLGMTLPDPALWAGVIQCGLAAILLGLIPIMAASRLLRTGPRGLGLGPGDLRWGARVAIPTAVLLFPLILLTQTEAAGICGFYPLSSLAGDGAGGYLAWEAAYLVYYVAWEGLFRGAIQIGLGDRWGFAPAAALQTALSALLHAGHPEMETLAAVVAGPILGWIAWRTRSIWPVVLIHFAAGAATDLSCVLLAP